MYNKESDTKDAMFENMLNMAAEYVADEQFEEAKEAFEPSQQYQDQKMRLLRMAKRSDRINSVFSVAKRVAVILMVCTIVSAAAIFSVDALRAKVFELFTGKNNRYTEINFAENAEIIGDYAVCYIPDGFKATERRTESIRFEDGQQYFCIDVMSPTATVKIDTEDATVTYPVINGNEAMYSTNANVNILVWRNDKHLFCITGDVDEQTMITIAKNIIKTE